jgi:hypothetical protein
MTAIICIAAYVIACWTVARIAGRCIDEMGGPDDE